MKKKHHLPTWTIALIFIVACIFIRADIVFITTYTLAIAHFISKKQTNNLKLLALSSTISFVWVFLNQNLYSYNQNYIEVAGIVSYPLFGWALGLLAMHLIYLRINKRVKISGFIKEFLLFSIPYWILLLLAETAGYHWLNIHDMATSAYPGLPICDCMHAPHWMQAVYLSLGPAYFLIIKATNRIGLTTTL